MKPRLNSNSYGSSSAIAIVALLVSICSVAYTMYVSENGPIFAKPKFVIQLAERIFIHSSVDGLSFGINLEIFNTGNAVGRIAKIGAILSLKNGIKKHLVTCQFVNNRATASPAPPSVITIYPHTSWAGLVKFCVPLTEVQMIERNKIKFTIGKEIDDQYVRKMKKNAVYAISTKLLEKIMGIFVKNFTGIEPGNYLFTLNLWRGPFRRVLLVKKHYSFRITQEMILALERYQADAYKLPPNYDTSMYVSYEASPKLLPIAQ